MSAPLEPSSERSPVADLSHPGGWSAPAAPGYGGDRLPTVVLLAAIFTGLASSLTLVFVVLAGLVLGESVAAIIEAFDVEHAHAWVRGTLAVFAAMCVASILCAVLIARRSRVARWALIALCALTVAVSALLALSIFVSILNAAAAGVVLVLLLMPEANRWFARSSS